MVRYAGVMQTYGPLDNYIIALRNQRGLSQRDVALLLDIDRKRVMDFENDRALPDFRNAIALELILDEPLQAIFTGVAERERALVAARARAVARGRMDKPSAWNAQFAGTLDGLQHLDEQSVNSWGDIG